MNRPNYKRVAVFSLTCLLIIIGALTFGESDGEGASWMEALAITGLTLVALAFVYFKVVPWMRDEDEAVDDNEDSP